MEEIVIWQAEPAPEVEFRLYYDEQGKVLFYTCEKHDGNYIVIDAQIYAEGRPDVLVVDGEIVRPQFKQTYAKLTPDITGTTCAEEDMSVLVDETYIGNKINWKYTIYEL